MTEPDFRSALIEAVLQTKADRYFYSQHTPLLDAGIAHVTSRLITEACKDPRIAELDGVLLNQENLLTGVNLMSLLQALIAHAARDGIDRALAAMDRFLAAPSNRSIEVLLLEGVAVNDTLEVVPGIFICPLAHVPSSTLQSYLKYTGAAQPPTPFSLQHLFDEQKITPGAALYTVQEATPKFLREPPEFKASTEAAPIYQIVDVLTIFGPCSPVISKSYLELADGEFLKGHVGFNWMRPRNETRVSENRLLTEVELADLREVAQKYLRLPPEVKQHLRVPIHRLNEAVKHQTSVDRALDLGIALESLLLAHQQSKDQLSLQFRLRGAWLLGRDAQHRTELFETFNKLYMYRSYAAHSGSIASKKTPEEEVMKTLSAGIHLCAQAIRKIIEDMRFPQWNRLLMGDDEENRE